MIYFYLVSAPVILTKEKIFIEYKRTHPCPLSASKEGNSCIDLEVDFYSKLKMLSEVPPLCEHSEQRGGQGVSPKGLEII